MVQLDLGHAPEPYHVLSRHSLPITDLHCGRMGAQARIATASLDQTVKVSPFTCTGDVDQWSHCSGVVTDHVAVKVPPWFEQEALFQT